MLTTFKVASPTNTRLKETLTTAFMMRMSPFRRSLVLAACWSLTVLNLARPSHFSEFASWQFAEIPFATVLIQKEEKNVRWAHPKLRFCYDLTLHPAVANPATIAAVERVGSR